MSVCVTLVYRGKKAGTIEDGYFLLGLVRIRPRKETSLNAGCSTKKIFGSRYVTVGHPAVADLLFEGCSARPGRHYRPIGGVLRTIKYSLIALP